MRDIHQKMGGSAEDASLYSVRSAKPPKEASSSANLQQERRAPQLMDSEQAELLLQLEEERLQVCGRVYRVR